MKQLLKGVIFLAALVTNFTAQATTAELAEKYLRATQIPEMLQAQVEGYTDQYAKGQDAAYRKRVHDYLERVMGWEALKKEYISLVQATYTEHEINAFVLFTKTPAGRSLKTKNVVFANKLATIAATRTQEVDAERQAANQIVRDEQEISPNELVIEKVEKLQNGDQVYFMGEVRNNSKKPARGVSIEANLFLGERFVDQYSTYITGTISPGSTRLFKITCGCKGSPPMEHDSFKVHVIAGY